MNPELVKKALEKVGSANVLVNLVSQRVRQLNYGGGGVSRPLVMDVTNLGAADIALREIIEDKITFEMPEIIELTRPTGRNRKRPQGWGKSKTGTSGEDSGSKESAPRKRALALA